jgi:hypothetical protein
MTAGRARPTIDSESALFFWKQHMKVLLLIGNVTADQNRLRQSG